jgi:hypothetical protein
VTTANLKLNQSLNTPDETRTFEKGKVEVSTLGEVTIGRVTLEPGWRWSTCVKPLVKTQSCQAGHTGYVVAGHVHVVMDDGTEFDLRPGDAFAIPPGHDAWVVGNETHTNIDVSGLADYARPR